MVNIPSAYHLRKDITAVCHSWYTLLNHGKSLSWVILLLLLWQNKVLSYDFDEWKSLYFGKPVHVFATDGISYYDNKTGYCYKGFWEPNEKGDYGIVVEPVNCESQIKSAKLPIWLTYAPDLERSAPWPYLRKSRRNLAHNAIFLPPGIGLVTVKIIARLIEEINDDPPYPKF